jgi:ABC-type cobalamin/Fe3+-siderophores transport system ATPase subunit
VALPLMRSHGRTSALRTARSALAWVGAAHCAEARWEHLSDSERALVSLAHGLAREPKLLLVDDVTARLDALQQAEVDAVLRRAADERHVAVLMTCSALSAAVGAQESFTISQRTLKRVTDPPVQGEVVRLRRQSGGADA